MFKLWHVYLAMFFWLGIHELFYVPKRRSAVAVKIPRNRYDLLTILKTEQFNTYYCKEDIPPFILQYLKSLSDDGFSIANPGEDYNCCCITLNKLPRRGLMFFARSKDHFVIHYNKGAGFVNFDILLLLSLKDQQVTGVWEGSAIYDATSTKDVIKYIETHNDERTYVGDNPTEI